MKRRAAAAAILLAAAVHSPVSAGVAADHGVAPWSEAVVGVAAFRPFTDLLEGQGGWTRTAAGKVQRAELATWNVPAKASASFERWCAPQASSGCIRFVRFTGVPQRPVRLAARAWDPGGIYSLMVRSDDVPALFDAAIKAGWWAESEPVRFTFGASDLRNVVLTGPHGINIAVYQRVSPPFTAFPVGRISHAFNSMRMVKNKARARDFYLNNLGFELVFDSDREPPEPARSNFGIPLNHTPRIPRAAAALQPVPGETGRVEVMEMQGFTGTDQSAHASPPNLGLLLLRFPVRDLAAYRRSVEAKGTTIAYAAQGVRIANLGTVDLFAVRDPDGNLTEFYHAH
ncbi:VOC family protein [Novosphingobium sp.]|uniref:VOC family protein n=1 Tax=Novosphingobium sp. TaxID=1874826 RepID=UPI0022BA9292|nr:VOC family protein [Novosphingobium sp.]MCZ8019478.1 VOC family protein [Novosphingobium sp.]MCZ8035293.1 VOC family protein [Novosphingobium sp.]MCZ8050607.1 VOC family protein [Novosphingobium sp.]MCZ8058953.1 VOC family protein [Novosphingobium sp.]MCZ8232398.1 VOC family protein [Novosphingobium sp.]